jgi:serine/threonine protein kinase
MDTGAVSEEIIWSFIGDLAQALSHVHNHNLVHLDLKPDNIFITPVCCISLTPPHLPIMLYVVLIIVNATITIIVWYS